MWKHFIKAIGLLTIALAAALYSSGAAVRGNVATAAVSALLALAIAAVVAVRFVPRLASHVDWQWLQFSAHGVTREGWIYFAAVAVVASAAVNTANNLLYMVLAALLAVLVLSWVLIAVNFASLRVAIRLPLRCYAREAFPIAAEVHNANWLFPAFSIAFEPENGSAFRFSRFYIPFIGTMETASRAGQAALPARGRYKLDHVRAYSRYPFGFFLKRRRYPVDVDCICFPEILPEDEVSAEPVRSLGSDQRQERGFGDELYMIRDYVPSDSARHVHWKASAKTASLKTREYAAQENRQVAIAFDRFGGAADADRFERLVSSAASKVFYLAAEGVEATLITDEWEGCGLEPVMEYLALVEMSASAARPYAAEANLIFSLRA